jgi:long-subunit fatty acid transport protein
MHPPNPRLAPILALAVLAAALPRPALAVDKFAAEFLKVGVGARALGMGGAFVAVADDASASYWNPAGLSFLDEPDLQLTHAEMFGSIVKHDVISGALPIGRNGTRSSVGLTVVRLAVDDIKNTKDALVEDSGGLIRVDPDKVRIESAYDLGLLFTYARALGDRWSIGGNVKMVRQNLVDDGSSFGIGADLGLLWFPSTSATLGLRLADITTTQIKWDTGHHETLAPTVTVGGQVTKAIKPLRGTLTPALDVQLAFENLGEADQFSSGSLSGNVHAGLEYWYNSTVALRAGSNSGHFAAGAGLRFRLGPFQKFGVDYAYLDHDELDSTNRVTLNLGW